MPSKNKIGEAYVEITADARDLDRNLDRAGGKVREYATNAERDLNKVSGAMDRQEKKSKSLAAGLFGLVGKATAAAGAFVALIQVLERYGEATKSGGDLTAEFISDLGSEATVNAMARHSAAVQRLNKLYEERQALLDNRFSAENLFGARGLVRDLTGQLEEEITSLRKEVKSAADQVRVQRDLDREREAKKFAEAIEREVTKALQNAIDRATASRRNSFNSVGLLEAATDSLLANSAGSISVGGS